jgi:hypothetical protein
MSSGGLAARLLACFALVFATWNPTGVSFYEWVGGSAPLALKAVAAAVLILLHIMFARIAWLSLGGLGLGFLLAMLFLGVFTLSEFDLIDLGRGRTWGYVLVSVAALTLMTGVTWSVMKRRVTGQSNYLNPPP